MKTVVASVLLLLLAATASCSAIEVGEKVPTDASLHFGFPPEEVVLKDRLAGKNVLLM